MRKQKYFAYGLCFVLILGTCSILTADSGPVYSSEMNMAGMALEKAFSEIGLPKGDRNLLVLTNAGYGQIGPQSTEGFLEITRETTGCSIGTRSLLTVHTSINEPLWCSILVLWIAPYEETCQVRGLSQMSQGQRRHGDFSKDRS